MVDLCFNVGSVVAGNGTKEIWSVVSRDMDTNIVTRCRVLLHCAVAAAQYIVIGPVCGFVCLWVYYHDNSKLRLSILTKLDL